MDGSPDFLFGKGGVVDMEIPHAGLSFGYGITIQPDGKIIAVGYTIKSHTSYDYTFLHFLPNGSLDSSFGTNGIVMIDGGQNSDEHLCKVSLQTGGRIVAYGDGNGDITLLRLNQDGSRDHSFGTKGIASLPYRGFDNGYALAVQNDGKYS